MSTRYHLSSVRAMYGRTLGVSIDELTIAPGELCVLVGPNGSGKSSLLGILSFLHKPEQGTVAFDDAPLSWKRKECASLRRRVTLLHQHPYMLSGSVADNVAFGLRARGVKREEARNMIREALAQVDLSGFESRTARKLSGGEIQRVALARALVCRPEVLLLDEPTANVDRASSALLESLFASLVASGMTIVISSHDDRLGAKLGARMIYLENGTLRALDEQAASTDTPCRTEENNAHA